jgi:hypothetical protein
MLGQGAVPASDSATQGRSGSHSAFRCCPASPSCTSLRGRLPSAPASATRSPVAPEGSWPWSPRRRDRGRARRRGRAARSRLVSRPRSASAAGYRRRRAPGQQWRERGREDGFPTGFHPHPQCHTDARAAVPDRPAAPHGVSSDRTGSVRDYRRPESCVTMSRGPSVSRERENRIHGPERGMGKRGLRAAPPTTNG